jgi:hypothetical protein
MMLSRLVSDVPHATAVLRALAVLRADRVEVYLSGAWRRVDPPYDRVHLTDAACRDLDGFAAIMPDGLRLVPDIMATDVALRVEAELS